jgi:hypothetical protein
MSPYYGKLGRNTHVGLSVVQATGERRYRFHGEVSSWPQKWDITGTDVYVEVEASGVLRRLGQGGQLSSAMYRVCARATRLVAYWPCEDEDSSVSLGSAVAAAKAMTISGTPTLASSTDFHASADLPVMGSASFTGYVPTYDSSLKQAQVRFLLSVPAGGATDNQIICTVYTTGATPRWELYYNTGFGGTLGLRGFNTVGANVADTGTQDFDVDGHPMRVSLEFVLTGTTLAATIETLVPGAGAALASGTSATGTTLGRITRVVLAPNKGLTDYGHGPCPRPECGHRRPRSVERPDERRVRGARGTEDRPSLRRGRRQLRPRREGGNLGGHGLPGRGFHPGPDPSSRGRGHGPAD